MIEEARSRIEAAPDLYIDHIWGEQEFGGTSVMYISDTPLGEPLRIPTPEEFEARAVPSLITGSIPDLVHKWVLVTPFQLLGGLVGLGGLAFFRRRNEVMEHEAAERAAGGKG